MRSRPRYLPLVVFLLLGGATAVGGQEPALTVEQMRAFLLNAKVIRSRGTPKGVTSPCRLTLTDGTLTHDAGFQSIDQQVSRREFTDGRSEMHFVDSYRYDIAAYELAVLLGLGDMMPVTVERAWNGKRGAMSWWLPAVMDEVTRKQAGAGRRGEGGRPVLHALRDRRRDGATRQNRGADRRHGQEEGRGGRAVLRQAAVVPRGSDLQACPVPRRCWPWLPGGSLGRSGRVGYPLQRQCRSPSGLTAPSSSSSPIPTRSCSTASGSPARAASRCPRARSYRAPIAVAAWIARLKYPSADFRDPLANAARPRTLSACGR